MDFPHHLYLPQETIVKKDASLELVKKTSAFGSRGVLVFGKSFENKKRKLEILSHYPKTSGVSCFCRNRGEPELGEVSCVIEIAKDIDAQWVVGIGGGSVIDLAKAAAGLFHAKHDPRYYQKGGILEEPGIPFIAVPTTCGAGSEATPNAVIINKEKKSKLSIRDASFLARTVILDVSLLSDLPKDILRYSAMDALVQAYESYISKNATWFSQALSLKAITLINENIESAYKTPDEGNLSSLHLASYLAGIALATARLGVIHGIAHPLGALYAIPHGHICSVCLIPSLEINKETMAQSYELLCGAVGMDFIMRIEKLLTFLSISSPFRNARLIEKEMIIDQTIQSGSTAANPKTITKNDVEFILERIFGT